MVQNMVCEDQYFLHIDFTPIWHKLQHKRSNLGPNWCSCVGEHKAGVWRLVDAVVIR